MLRSSRHHTVALTAALAVLAAGCAGTATSGAPTPVAAASADRAALAQVRVDVISTESCSCCKEWVAYLEQLGATVEVTYTDDLQAAKDAAGVPREAGSCHTATVEGYTVEGHVPAAAILDLLERRPDVDGIALPGMPAGSPGMPGDAGPLEVVSFDDGTTSTFGTY